MYFLFSSIIAIVKQCNRNENAVFSCYGPGISDQLPHHFLTFFLSPPAFLCFSVYDRKTDRHVNQFNDTSIKLTHCPLAGKDSSFSLGLQFACLCVSTWTHLETNLFICSVTFSEPKSTLRIYAFLALEVWCYLRLKNIHEEKRHHSLHKRIKRLSVNSRFDAHKFMCSGESRIWCRGSDNH